MKIQKGLIEFNNGIVISYWQTITEIFNWKNYNWNTWQFFNVEFENDIMLGAYEFTFVFLCCGIRIRIPHKTEKSKKEWKKLNQAMKKIEQSCDGWVNKEMYEKFRKKEGNYIQVDNVKSKRRTKKVFIQ